MLSVNIEHKQMRIAPVSMRCDLAGIICLWKCLKKVIEYRDILSSH